MVANIRLTKGTFEKMEKLRQLGFVPSVLMRRAIEQVLDETLQKAKKAGL